MKSVLFTWFLFRKKKKVNFYAREKSLLGRNTKPELQFHPFDRQILYNILNCVWVLHLWELVYKGESTHTTITSVPQEMTSQFQSWQKARTQKLLRMPKPTDITVSCLKLWGRRCRYPEDRSSTFSS